MPPPCSVIWPALGLLLVACSNSSSGTAPIELGSARIGAAGGELRIDSGPQAGLVLTIPPGALAADTTLRIVQVVQVPLPAGVAATSEAATPGRPFRLEPTDVLFETPASLRIPFVPEVLYYQTGLGNVRVYQQSAAATWEREPTTVDVGNRFVETAVNTGGVLQVIVGPRAQSLYDYFPAIGTNVPLQGGGSFRCEQVNDGRFSGRDLYRWRLELVPAARDFGYMLENAAFVGRFDIFDDWLEMWPPASAETQLRTFDESYAYQGPFSTMVYSPASAPLSLGGTVQRRIAWRFREPVIVGGQRVLDVLELRVGVAWRRSDLPDGSEDIILWFAPGHGFLGVRDGAQETLRASL